MEASAARRWSSAEAPRGQLLSMKIITIVAAVVVAVTLLALALLVWPLQLIELKDASIQLDALRTSLAIGAGAAGAATLILAARRQVHQERVAAITEEDATERRITDLYGKAVDQLGSEKPAVRLGGLYGLERLAEGYPSQRQTVVNVICAYLRMPYLPPPGIGVREVERAWDLEPKLHTSAVSRDTWAHALNQETGDQQESSLQEWQVRLTAQRILAQHLRGEPSRDPANPRVQMPPPGGISRDSKTVTTAVRSSHWKNIDIDLTGAILFDFDFRRCRVKHAIFRMCRFMGIARFYGASFSGDAEFDGAEFFGSAWFEHAEFGSNAWFGGARFGRTAGFDEAKFRERALFGTGAWLGSALFGGEVGFRKTHFSSMPELGGARVTLDGATQSRSWPEGWAISESDGAVSEFEGTRWGEVFHIAAD